MKKIYELQKMYMSDEGLYTVYFLTEDEKDWSTILKLSINSDFTLCGETQDMLPETNGHLEILIDDNNLFYPPLQEFLGNKDCITIEDDMVYQRYGKKVSINRVTNGVLLIFEYIKAEDFSEFCINIKNINYDGRSKIDQNGQDTKERLHKLFYHLHMTFKNHQTAGPNKILTKNI